MSAPELSRREQAELLVEGIEACGLDADEELDRIATLPPFRYCLAIREYQLAGISARMTRLPGDAP